MCGFCGNGTKPQYCGMKKSHTEKGGKIIAIYHCSIKIISRGKGKSAVGSAAYRSGEKLVNEYDGMTHDYTRKGGVVHTEILLPDNAPREYLDRSTLWNAVERIEKARNSQLAREVEISLPNELTLEQNIALAKEYVQKTFVDKGMCADMRFSELAEWYFENYAPIELKEGTVYNYKSGYNNHIKPALEHLKVKDINTPIRPRLYE